MNEQIFDIVSTVAFLVTDGGLYGDCATMQPHRRRPRGPSQPSKNSGLWTWVIWAGCS